MEEVIYLLMTSLFSNINTIHQSHTKSVTGHVLKPSHPLYSYLIPTNIFLYLVPHSSSYSLETLQPSLTDASYTLKLVGQLQIFTILPIFHIQLTKLNPRSVKEKVFWPLLNFWPHTMNTKQILVKDLALLHSLKLNDSPLSLQNY